MIILEKRDIPDDLLQYFDEVAVGRSSIWTLNTGASSSSHYACVDEETECLTISGWKKYSELVIGEIIASFNMKTKLLRWERLESIYINSINDEMYEIQKSCINFKFSHGHRMLCINYKTKSKTYSDYYIKKIQDVTSHDKFLVSNEWENGSFGLLKQQEPTLNMSKILGWICSDGHFWKYSIQISQSITANPEKVKRIENLLIAENIRYKKYVNKSVRHTKNCNGIYRMAIFSISWYEVKKILYFIPDKKPVQSIIMWSKEKIEGFLNEFIDGDGHIRKDGRICITQKNEYVTDILSVLAFRLGYRVIKSYVKSSNVFRLYLTKHKYSDARGKNGTGLVIKKSKYSGIIWCPETKSSTFVARRNGKIIITGNSFNHTLTELPIKACCPELVCSVCRIPAKVGCDCKASMVKGVVYDVFSGIATTARSAKKLNRDYIGSDISKEYHNVAKKLMEKEDAQKIPDK